MVDADYLTDLDQPLAQSLCLYWYFRPIWCGEWLPQLHGIGQPTNSLYRFSFIFVAAYIEIPFMVLPIFNAIDEIDGDLIKAGYDLGTTRLQNFSQIIFPLSMNGVRSGVQAVFIPSLSLFMLTRLIGGNRVITLGTAIEEHFLVTQNWGMGATIGMVLIITMFVVMYLTRERGGKA